jgi:hypothetical protein
MQKLSGNSLDKFNKSCSSLHQESRKIEFAFFRIFLRFSRDFTRISKSVSLLKFPFCCEVLRPSQNLIDIPLDCMKHRGKTWSLAMWPLAMGAARLWPIPANLRRSRRGRWLGSTMCSPRAQGWPKLGRRGRQRGRTARTRGGVCGGRCCRRGSVWAGQQAALGAPVRPRGSARVVRWL